MPPLNAVKISMSCWMRWSGLSIGTVDELAAVVRAVVEPVTHQSVRQPDPPTDDEPLHQIVVDHGAHDVDDRDDREDVDGHAEDVDAGIADAGVAARRALERHLERGVQVVAVVAQQNADTHCDHHQHQQH